MLALLFAPFRLLIGLLAGLFALLVTALALTGAALIVVTVFTFVGLILFAVSLPFLLPIIGLLFVLWAIVSIAHHAGLGKAL
jgi:hypothetical protein